MICLSLIYKIHNFIAIDLASLEYYIISYRNALDFFLLGVGLLVAEPSDAVDAL